MLVFLIEFLFFAFLGFIIDSLYSSLSERRLIISGYFPGLPLCPIYGFGGVLLLRVFLFLVDSPAWQVILLGGLLMILLEYLGGVLAELILGERLWDYSKEKWNLDGYISAWHSFLWLLLVAVVYLSLGKELMSWHNYLAEHLLFNQSAEWLLGGIIFLAGFYLTIKTKKLRLAKRKRKKASA